MLGGLSALAQISFALAALVMIYLILRLFIPLLDRLASSKKNGNGHSNGRDKAGELSAQDWEGRMTRMHQESEERLMGDMRLLMEARTMTLVEKVTDPIVKELRGLRDDMARGRQQSNR